MNGVVHRLFGELVFEFESRDGQAIDEHCHVEGKCGLVAAVTKLSRYAEDICREPFDGFHIAWCRCPVEEIHMGRTVLNAVAQTVDHAALGDLALQAVEEG